MRRNRGFTLIELLVVIGIIAVLLGILIPVVTGARNSAKKTQCAAHLRTIGQAMTAYAGDIDRKLPVFGNDSDWLWNISIKTRDALLKSGADRTSLYCPALDTESDNTYWNYGSTNPDNTVQDDEKVSTNVGYFMLLRRVPKATTSGSVTDPPKEKLQSSKFEYLFREQTPSKPVKPYKRAARVSMDQARPAEMELASDITISTGTGTARKFISLASPDYKTSTHLTSDKTKAEGGNVLFMDGHVEWRRWKEPPPSPTTPVPDDQMQIRYTSPSPNIDHWF
jgi:prepilin-type N-terminal cleavage/methylation domain-containing protein/prepilin-type processing-associated H-X9-DG protein